MSHASIVMYGTGGTGDGPRWDRCPQCGGAMVLGVCPTCVNTGAQPRPFATPSLTPCGSCKRFVVTGTLCPWCTPPAEPPTPEVSRLRAALKKVRADLFEERTECSKIAARLDDKIAEIDRALKEGT